MPIVYNAGSEPVLFIHIPKTGGTSVLKALGIDTPANLPAPPCGDLPVTPQHFHRALLQQLGIDKLVKKSLAVVREPMARLLSEYRYLMRFEKYHAQFLSFDAFVEIALSEYQKNNFVFDNHIRPQHEFLLANTQVYRLEDGYQHIQRDLQSRFNLQFQAPIGHLNRSSNNAIKFSPSTLARVKAFYAEDYRRLGYSAPEARQAVQPNRLEQLNQHLRIPVYRRYFRLRAAWANLHRNGTW